MLTLKVGTDEIFNSVTNEFSYKNEKIFHLEYSLKAISLWESKYEEPFINKKELTTEQFLDFLSCMVIGDESLPTNLLRDWHMKEIDKYMSRTHTATTITHHTSNKNKRKSPITVMTSEVYYAIMAQANIPFECELWNINRLVKLIETLNVLNDDTPMSNNEALRHQAMMNAKRRSKAKKG